jgi:hypothetical protein
MIKPKRLDELIAALLTATEGKRLAWAQTADHDCFSVSFRESSVSVSKDDECAVITIINSDGRPVWEQKENSRELNELYLAARRVAMNTDAFLDTVLAELEAMK